MEPYKITVPLDVPAAKRSTYLRNFKLVTKGTGRLLLAAGDQRVEHLNEDFYGTGIAPDDAFPEHLFKIAAGSRVGLFATQLGYIARFADRYRTLNYCVKLNSKSHIVKPPLQDPFSSAWYDVAQIIAFAREAKLSVPAIGYTVYVGSKFEAPMLREAAQLIWQAHQAGMLAVLWMYPRGESISNINDPHLIAGAVNVGSALGADFMKVNGPLPASAAAYREIMSAAQGSRVIFAGGEAHDIPDLLDGIDDEVNKHGAAGAALGRNLHQRPLPEAIAVANAAASVIYDGQPSVKAFQR